VSDGVASGASASNQVPFYSRQTLCGALDLGALIDALDEAHRLGVPETSDCPIGPASGRLFVRGAVLPGQAMGAKVVSIFPENLACGTPSVQALFVLFDGGTGSPRAVLDATGLTYWKTAADSALGARYLSREDARTLLMVGAGALAPWLVRAHLCARPSIVQVLVWNRTERRAAELAATLTQAGIHASSVSDLAAAADSADIVSTATMARTPLIRGEWLKPGTHLDLVGAYAPDTREADDACFRRARVFTDYRPSAHDVGEIRLPMASGALRVTDLIGDLYDLARGMVGRRAPSDITLFKNAGGAHLDLMTASFLLRRMEKT